MDLIVTVNFADGHEINDIPVECDSLADLPEAVELMLGEKNAKGYSSLVIVVVPKS